MELAVVNPQAVLQMYQCKDHPWQALATSPLLLTAATTNNKEEIIAMTDFTTTSAIARRRLSSKKRRNNLGGGGGGSGGDSGGEGSSSSSSSSSPSSMGSSPTSSMDPLLVTRHHPQTTVSPAILQHTSPSINSLPQHSLVEVPTTSHPSTHLPPHTHTHLVVPPHPQATTTATGTNIPLVPAAYHFAQSLPMATTSEHKAFAHHPVYSQLQQELNYRYLQEQQTLGPSSVRAGNRGAAAFSTPRSQPSRSLQHTAVGVATEEDQIGGRARSNRVRWCTAHVTIAKQILTHQLQTKASQQQNSVGAAATNAAGTETLPSTKPVPPPPSSLPLTTSSAAIPPPTAVSSLDQAQQIALLQMYGVPTTAGGYMAAMPGVSYPTLPPDIQLRNLSFIPNTALLMNATAAGNVLSFKQLPQQSAAVSLTHMETTNSNGQGGAGAGGGGPQMMKGVQILPYPAPTAAAAVAAVHHQPGLPLAAVVPGVGGGGGGGGVATAPNGSYVGHVPVPIIGNCVLNPCQPGVMATPWVR